MADCLVDIAVCSFDIYHFEGTQQLVYKDIIIKGMIDDYPLLTMSSSINAKESVSSELEGLLLVAEVWPSIWKASVGNMSSLKDLIKRRHIWCPRE
jgi:hypothetical protein